MTQAQGSGLILATRVGKHTDEFIAQLKDSLSHASVTTLAFEPKPSGKLISFQYIDPSKNCGAYSFVRT